jgi:hypothetical protein
MPTAGREHLVRLGLFGRHPAGASTAAGVIVSSLGARKCARGRLEPLAEDAFPLAGDATTPRSGVQCARGRRTVGTATVMINPSIGACVLSKFGLYPNPVWS